MRVFLVLSLVAMMSLASCSPNARTPRANVASTQPAAAAQALDLPLHAVGAANSREPTFAIFLTGDGGWASFDRRVCADLAAQGVPTIGFDTGAYFDNMRSPDEAAAALARTLRAGMAQWHANRAIVVGYSFGADVAPFLINRLPADLRSHIDRVALMAPSSEAPFQVTAAERVGLSEPGARPVVPEIQQTSQLGLRIVCLYGVTDQGAICPHLSIAAMKDAPLSGGHGFHGDDEGVAHAILSAWPVVV